MVWWRWRKPKQAFKTYVNARESLFLGLKMKNIDRRAEKFSLGNKYLKIGEKTEENIKCSCWECLAHVGAFSCVFLKNKGYFCQINSIYHRDDLLLELTVEQRELSSWQLRGKNPIGNILACHKQVSRHTFNVINEINFLY